MNIMQWACVAVLFVVWSTVLSSALADGMRCGNKLVVTGDTKLEVLKKCGEPDFSETIKTLAGLCRFVIVDIANPKSSPLELQATVPDYMIPFLSPFKIKPRNLFP